MNAEEAMIIKGLWHSRYEYGRGVDDESQASEHRVRFVQDGNKWVGTSLPSEDGSAVRVELTQQDREFGGSWTERTSSTGYYEGREFKGLILLLLSQDGQWLEGRWLGAGSSSGRVKSGVWTFAREMQ